ncbi:EthD domain-containing protein [Steroidobacter sp.]|uniref:EthD domain-containing protein n=1 Tax=Steroidobacter sp. TaxID=1978227 RepID=UPI001A42C208|nr:EthD domain-containing protein [Steroidobacter sp.]MBL8266976.1 EthD domain-containing protein [Steroidobacter sp.]
MIRPKLMYLARRNPSLTAQQFTPRWRQHGALGMSMPRWKNIWRYVHCDVLSESGNDYDGVGIVWHKSPETRRAHREDTSSQATMEADELQTFDQLVVKFCALMAERTVLEPANTAKAKLIRFARAEGVVPAELTKDSAAHAERLLSGSLGKSLRGVVQNHAQPSESGRPWGLPYEYIEELWFDSVQEAADARTALRGVVPSACSGFEPIAVLTNEVVLYQVSEAAATSAI